MHSDKVTFENAAEQLIERVPRLAERYKAELEWWGNEKPGAHIVYGDILNPHIEGLLQDGNDQELERVFAFVEELAISEDVRLREIVAVTICEGLGKSVETLRQARRFM